MKTIKDHFEAASPTRDSVTFWLLFLLLLAIDDSERSREAKREHNQRKSENKPRKDGKPPKPPSP